MKNTEKLSGYVTNLTGKRKVHMVFVAKKKKYYIKFTNSHGKTLEIMCTPEAVAAITKMFFMIEKDRKTNRG